MCMLFNHRAFLYFVEQFILMKFLYYKRTYPIPTLTPTLKSPLSSSVPRPPVPLDKTSVVHFVCIVLLLLYSFTSYSGLVLLFGLI